MPPRRTKRAKTFNDEAQVSPTPAVSTTTQGDTQSQVTPINGDNGKCKFVELPVELLLEIMSYFPAVPVPTSRRWNTPVLPPSVLERWDALRALSQTCRLWRTIFYPILWERMEACAVREHKVKKPVGNSTTPAPAPAVHNSVEEIGEFRGDDIPASWYKGVSRLLEKVGKGLTSDPQAAQHVRTVNVSLTRCSPTTVLPAFVQCLENLPNLQTLQILRAHTQMSAMLKTYFEGHTFPAVRTIIVPEHGHEILKCCPNVKRVVCNYGDGSKIITAINKRCKNVEVVEGISGDKNFLKRLAKTSSGLRKLTLIFTNSDYGTTATELFTALTPFKSLTWFELQLTKNFEETYLTDPYIATLIKGGKNLLDNGVPGEKKFRLFYAPVWSRYDKGWSLNVPV